MAANRFKDNNSLPVTMTRAIIYRRCRDEVENLVHVQIVSAQIVSGTKCIGTNCFDTICIGTICIGHKLYRAQTVSGTNCIL